MDATSAATPLGILAEGTGESLPAMLDMFFGVRAGCLGETCAAALLIGGLYLMLRRVISPVIPLCYLGTAALLSLAFGMDPTYQLLSGGLLLGAIFMATDYATTPITKNGQILFGICCGVITFLFRNIGGTPEGVSYAIILSNLLVPLIEKITVPRAFGVVKAKKEGK